MGTLQFDSPSHIPDEKSVSLTTQTTRHSPLAVWIAWHETTLLPCLCWLRYLIASSMQIQRREGLEDICIVMCNEATWDCIWQRTLSFVHIIITHEKIFSPSWKWWRPGNKAILPTIVYEFYVRQNKVSYAHTCLPGTKWTQGGKLLI